MKSVFYLSSMDSKRFSGVFECEIKDRVVLEDDRHALLVSCDPPALGQDLNFPLGISDLTLVNRFAGDDVWNPKKFPFFVYICDTTQTDNKPSSLRILAWGEIYRNADDARNHRFDP